MGNKTVTVTLGETNYEVPRLNTGQLEDLADRWEATDDKGSPLDDKGLRLKGRALMSWTLDTTFICLRRASPPIADVRDLECGVDELREAMTKVLAISGMKKAEATGEVKAAREAA
jgi:hypothetical protein